MRSMLLAMNTDHRAPSSNAGASCSSHAAQPLVPAPDSACIPISDRGNRSPTLCPGDYRASGQTPGRIPASSRHSRRWQVQTGTTPCQSMMPATRSPASSRLFVLLLGLLHFGFGSFLLQLQVRVVIRLTLIRGGLLHCQRHLLSLFPAHLLDYEDCQMAPRMEGETYGKCHIPAHFSVSAHSTRAVRDCSRSRHEPVVVLPVGAGAAQA